MLRQRKPKPLEEWMLLTQKCSNLQLMLLLPSHRPLLIVLPLLLLLISLDGMLFTNRLLMLLMDSSLLSMHSSREQLDGSMINSNGLKSSMIVLIRPTLLMSSPLRKMELPNPSIGAEHRLLMRLKLLDKDLLMLSLLRLAILLLSLPQRLPVSLIS